jgi:glutathione S-transferase
MYVLHYAPGAASLCVHLALREIGAPFELVRVDLAAGEQKSPAYLALNPHGVVPTLVVDGTPGWEAAGLLQLLADRHPEARLAPPADGAARVAYASWLMHLANTLQPAFRTWFYPHEPAGEGAQDAAREAARARIEATWERIDARLAANGGHLAGDHLSMADILAFMLMRWSRNMPRPATTWPAIASFVAAMKARPSFAAVYAAEGLTEWA